jgi:SAM-dependent methyltransferase
MSEPRAETPHPLKELYTPDYFSEMHDDSLRSASATVPLVMSLLRPRSVVDLGCGTGSWLQTFRDHGVAVALGVDGPHVDPEQLVIPRDCFQAHDLTQPFRGARTFDLAIALEVAHHLPASAADVYVDSLCHLAPLVLFSAAVPEQGGSEGIHHVNEQWPWYWHQRFEQRGYVVTDSIRPQIWQNERIAPWYRQNIFLMIRRDVWQTNERLANLPIVSSIEPMVLVSAAVLTSNLRLRATLRRLPPLIVDELARRLRRQERRWPWQREQSGLWHEQPDA